MQLLAGALGAPERQEAFTESGVVVAVVIGGTVMRPGVDRTIGRETGDQALAEAFEELIVDIARTGQASARTATAE